MPLRIARPKPPETEFRRKRAPPPQATKLLLYSLVAGLVFMGALAVVFIPRYLENLNRPPVEILFLEAQAGGRIVVNRTTDALPLSKFNATLLQGNDAIASLSAGLSSGSAVLAFTDANGNHVLDAGDYFTVSTPAAGNYHLVVWQADAARLVGLFEWSGSLS